MFTLDDDIMRQLRATFKIEAAEHIQALNRILLALEKNPEDQERSALLQEIFREAHSLKGAAGAADFRDVESTAHKLESIFGAAKKGKITLTHDLCDVLYAGIDAVSVIIDAALEEKPHGIDLDQLHARLIAAEHGEVLGGAGPARPAVSENAETPRQAESVAADKVIAPTATAPTVQPAVAAAQPEPQVVPAVQPAVAAAQPEPQVVPAVQPAVAAVQPKPQVVPAVVAEQRVQEAPKPADKPAAAENAPKVPKSEPRKRASSAAGTDETIRVSTDKIDALMAQAGELLVAGLKIDQRLHEVEQIKSAVQVWTREWLEAGAAQNNLLKDAQCESVRPLVRLLELNRERMRTISTQVSELQKGLARDALHLSRVTNDLGEGVMKVRMLPVSTVFDAFPRMVRDLARDSQKEIELRMEGTETELDRKMLEGIKDPLMHILRNAADHGIERPEVRTKAGKPREGLITLEAFQKGNTIVIQVEDDGGGINRAKVKQTALKAGLITSEEMAAMSDDEAMRLIFAPGLSTSPMITDISGRGVGMDVVRKNVEALQGQVDVESTLGQGTTITLTLPLTLATTQELFVQVGDQTYGIPITAVERIRHIYTKDIASVQGRPAIVVGDEPVSLVRLDQVLELPAAEQAPGSDGKMPTVLLRTGKRRIAFLVDAVVGQQETVVKSLGKQLARVRNVAGATILGTGQVIMTLNPMDLIKSARNIEGRAASAAAPRPNKPAEKKPNLATILVVDDSLSTRTLEKNILETAGYKVVVATDGQEALTMLSSNGGCDLIVSDVMMPRMSGFELTSAVRADAKLKKIPVVLVTSLDSREDKERGIEVGADAYLIKSNFDQSNLLQTISQLV